MKNNLVKFFLVGLIYLLLPSDSFAKTDAETCSEMARNGDTSDYTKNFSNCMNNISKAKENLENKEEAPRDPGTRPDYSNCDKIPILYRDDITQCKRAAVDQYNAEKDAYNDWLAGSGSGGAGSNYAGKSASETLNEINTEINNAIDKLTTKQTRMKNAATVLMSVGGLLLAIGGILMFIPPVGWALIGSGGALVITGIILQVIAGTAVQKQIDELRKQANQTCESYNKVNKDRPLECNSTTVTAGTGSTMIGDAAVTYQPADITAYIDPTTGQCRKSAPAECKSLAKQLPPDCFKKGGACMAAKPSAMTINPNGTVTGKLNGKTATIGLDDLKDQASMIKAGFTPAQAKEFFSGKNNPFDTLKANGLDVKGDLRNLRKDDFGLSYPSALPSSSGSSSASPKTTNSISSDYVAKPAESTSAERDMASVAGEVTKEFKGDQIGLGNEDVFKMINRRYNLKNKQNNFLDQ